MFLIVKRLKKIHGYKVNFVLFDLYEKTVMKKKIIKNADLKFLLIDIKNNSS